MSIFTDDFQRANGPLGGNWATATGSWTIVSGFAQQTSPGFGMAVNSTLQDTGRHEAIAICGHSTSYSDRQGAVVKYGANGSNAYWAMAYGNAPNFYFAICKGSTAQVTYLTTVALPAAPQGLYTIRIIWDNGHLTATLDGGYTLEADDSDYLAGSVMGMVAGVYCPGIASVSFITGAAMGLSADPNVIGNYGQCTDISLTGSNTNWVAGTPGSPIFTVDHGTISAQTVIDATHATITYCPGDYLGDVTITDPSTGQTVGIVVTSDPNVIPPSGLSLSSTAIEYIERSAIAQDTPTILNQELDPWSAYPPVAMYNFLRDLYKRVTGNEEPPIIPYPSSSDLNELYARIWGGEEWLNASFVPPGTNSVAKKADYLISEMDALRTVVPYDLLDVQNNLSTDWTYSIKAVYELIQAGVPVDLQAVIDLLLSIRGSDTASIAYNELLIKGIGGLNGYSLDDIKAWVESARGAGLPSIADILTKLGPSGINVDTQLSGILQAALGAETYALNANDAIHRIEGVPQRTLQNILDAIANIPGGSNQDVLDALAVIVGVPTTTLRAIMDYLVAMRGDGTTTLKMILDAAQADPANTNYSIPALLALLMAALMGGTGAVTSLIAKLVDGKLDLVLDILGVIIDGANFFHTLWDHFNPSSATYSPITVPVYPGIDKVQLLDPVPFVDGCNLALRMDGALIDIATPGEHPYAIKNTSPTRYGRLGTFAFTADTARLECIQPIQYLTFIATPRAIALPTGIVVQCKSGTVGTVVPYRLT